MKLKLENHDGNVKILKSNGKTEQTKLLTNQTVKVKINHCVSSS
jgi:hypothetical protein